MSWTAGMPEVTVIIPTRNRWSLLRRSIRTALWQEEVDIEVIVVDDGSTDETPDGLAQLQDERVRVVRHEASVGQSAARNVGIRTARAPWIAFLDDDDLWAPGKLRSQLDVAANGVSLVFCGTIFIDARGHVTHERLPAADDVAEGLLHWNIVGPTSTVLARTTFVRTVGGFDEEQTMFVDWDLWIRLVGLGRAVAVPQSLVAYRLHAGNVHSTPEEHARQQITRLESKLREGTPPRQLAVDRLELARYLAGGQRRGGRSADAVRIYLRSGLEHRSSANMLRGLALLTLGDRPLLIGRRLFEPRASSPDWLDEALEI